jgi:predicted anti-sigma-YlaC factor YlaD
MNMGDSACERARCFACLRPDGELTDIQEKFLAFHLADCPLCRDFAEAVAGTTTAIRATAPVEAPELRVVGAVSPSRRRRFVRALPATAAAAAVAATAGLAGLAGVPPQQEGGVPPAPRPAYLDSATYEQGLIGDLQRVPRRGYPGPSIAT